MSYKQVDHYGNQYGNNNAQYGGAQPQTAYQQVPQDASGYQGHTSPTYAPSGSPVLGKNHEHTLQGEPLYGDSISNPELQRFRVAGWQDTWAMVLFYLQFIACIVVAGINIGNSNFSTTSSDNGGSASTGSGDTTVTVDVSETAKIFGKAAGAALGFASLFTVIFLGLMKAFPASFIWIAQGFFILLFAAYAGVGFYFNLIIMGVIGIIFCLLTCLWLFCIRHRIPFSALLLESSSNCILRFSGTVVLAFVTLILAVVYFVFWTMMTIPTLAKFEEKQVNSDNVNIYSTAGITFLFLLMFFWTTQVCQGVVRCTASGMLATWYFVGEADMPPNPSWAAFKRAMTTSFGSICFGALIVAILKTIEAFARAAYRNNRNSIGACIALCVISCIERLMEYFNEYALCFVSIYGCSYIEAAKEVWNMIMNGSIWAGVINDILVDRVFVMVSIFEGALCGVICYFIFDKHWVAAVAGALVGLVVAGVVFNTVASGCTCLLVCVADAPEVFQTKHPELSRKITHAIKELRKGCCDSSESA